MTKSEQNIHLNASDNRLRLSFQSFFRGAYDPEATIACVAQCSSYIIISI